MIDMDDKNYTEFNQIADRIWFNNNYAYMRSAYGDNYILIKNKQVIGIFSSKKYTYESILHRTNGLQGVVCRVLREE